MNPSDAYKILGIGPEADMSQIKKRYRRLMHQVHPDAYAFAREAYAYSAMDINEAYSFLVKSGNSGPAGCANASGCRQSHNPRPRHWDAPENEEAYASRNIYHYAEDCGGEVLGIFVVATGRFLWKPEEDFSLFLKSLSECSKTVLTEALKAHNRTRAAEQQIHFQAELAYLLAQQFTDASATLKSLLTPVPGEKGDVFFLPAMLERSDTSIPLRPGMTLYPSALKHHRLFLKTAAGREAGYLSLRDDRLYYIVIPLLEQRRAQVKILVSAKQEQASRSRKSRPYKNLDFWLRLPAEYAGTFPENINLQIEELLKRACGQV